MEFQVVTGAGKVNVNVMQARMKQNIRVAHKGVNVKKIRAKKKSKSRSRS